MRNKLLIFILMAALLMLVAGCSDGTVVKINTPVPNTQTGTHTPDGQINVPGVNIQINEPGGSIQINLPGPNPLVNQAGAKGHIAGVLAGIWHGIISPVTLVVSFINPDIQMFEVHNDGSPYSLGFLLGVAIVFIILGAFAGSRRR
jgi:hypothetical protein